MSFFPYQEYTANWDSTLGLDFTTTTYHKVSIDRWIRSEVLKGMLEEDGVMKLFPIKAPQHTTLPYATYQTVNTNSFNHLNGAPKADDASIQVDVWATTYSEAFSIYIVLRDIVESKPSYAFTSILLEEHDSESNAYRISFSCDFVASR